MASSNVVASSSVEKLIKDLTTTKTRMVTLKSCDNELFEVEDKVAIQSLMIKNMIEDCTDTIFPLLNVEGPILAKVVEFSKRHVEFEEMKKANLDEVDEKLKTFDKEFVEELTVDHDVLFDVINAANYLDHKELLDLCCKTVADMIKGKSPEDIRTLFQIVNDYTPEEEAEFRRENHWAFE